MSRKIKHDVKAWEREPNDKKFVRVYSSMLISKAYISLSAESKVLYILLKNNYYGSGSTAVCPYDDIAELTGIARKRIKQRIDELKAFGFIKVGVSDKNKRGKPANLYEFIGDWKDIKTDADVELAKAKIKDTEERKRKARERIEKMLTGKE